MVGEFFGLYGLAGKFSAVTGPIIWGITLAMFEPRWASMPTGWRSSPSCS
jgi:MFS-type transporter involved in bile tolerance (Atg22 family)